jgi:hypothetical protein
MRLLFWIVPILFASSSLACAQAPNGDARSPGTIGRLAPQEIQPLPRRGPVALAPLPTRNFGGQVYHGRLAWERGRWHHSTRNGQFGWWWDVSGVWYFYPEPSEGPPNYVSDTEVADETASDPTTIAAQPPPAKKSSHVFYYRPGDLKGIPYDGIEECTTARKRAEDVGVCVMK